MGSAYTHNDGTQTITFDYQQPATGETFNTLLKDLLKAGIYKGGNLAVESTSTISISPYTAVLYDSELTDIAIRVETEDSYILNIDVTNYVVVLQYGWYNTTENYVKMVAVDAGAVVDTDVIVGIGLFNGSDELIGVSYTDDSFPREVISKDADTILLGSVSIDSQPTGGTDSLFTGNSTYVTAVLTDLYDRLIDLSGVSDISVKTRHIDLDITTGTDGNDFKTGNTLNYQGLTPSTIIDTTTITTAIQTVIDLVTDLSGANDDSVDRRHINFGTGGDQISLKDFIIGITGSQAINGSFPDYSFSSTTAIQTALTDLASIVNDVATQVNTNTAKASTDLEGRVTTLEAKTTVDDFPIGTIIMYSGQSWNDGMLGSNWKVCNGTNGTPNLIGNFIKGASSLSAVESENHGGDASVVLTDANIPDHVHGVSLSLSGGVTNAKNLAHVHSIAHTHGINISPSGSGGYTGVNANAGDNSSGTLTTAGASTANSGGMSANVSHSHTVSGSINGNTNSFGQVSPTAISLNPAHYLLIFVMKTS